MEFVLLLFAMLGLVAQSAFFYTLLFLLHAVAATGMAWKLLRKQPLTATFIVSYIAMYFPNPVAVMAGWIPLESGTTTSVLYTTNALILIGLDLFIIAARRFRRNPFYANRLPLTRLEHIPLDACIGLVVLACAAFLGLLIVAGAALGLDVFTVSKSVNKGYGAHTTYYLLAEYSFTALPLAVFLVGLKPPRFQPPYLLPIAILLLYHFMLFQVRTVPIAVLIAYVVARITASYFVTIGAQPLRGRLAATTRMGLLVGVPLIVVVGVSIKHLRASYARGDYGLTEDRLEYLLEHTFAGGDLGFSIFLRKAMVYFPDSHPYLKGQSYYRLLFVPIPRAIWPGKPQNTNRVFARVLDPDLERRNVTIPPGIVGDLYINFGPVGVFGMMVFGALFGRERYRNLTDLLFLAGMGNWIFHLTRGALTNPLVLLVATWIGAGILAGILMRGVTSPPMNMTGVADVDRATTL